MPRRVIAVVGACLVLAACSGDDASPAPTTQVTVSSTTTVPPSLTERGDNVSFPAARTVEVHDATLLPGEAIGFAFHPNGTVTRVSASSPSLELCPATTDGAVDLTGGSWSGGTFDACRPLADGVPSPGTASHVGFALRSSATDDITIDATITYDAGDGFFLWAPPPECGTLTIHPESSDVVGVSGGATVAQDGEPVTLHFDSAYGYELNAGRVVPREPVEVKCAADRAPNTDLIVDWA